MLSKLSIWILVQESLLIAFVLLQIYNESYAMLATGNYKHKHNICLVIA